ncbi:MAG: stage II sporulation protein M [Acidobacteria bacterium]|nr:MAG: stage II sporulation protein M [Acidobacteriota bacterium]
MKLEWKQYVGCFIICGVIFTIGFFIAVSFTIPESILPRGTFLPDNRIVPQLQTAKTFKLIFMNNSRVFLMLTLGILTCGILSVIQSFLIGGSVGLAVRLSIDAGAPSSLAMAALLPHGIFELAAFMLVAALGLYFPYRIYRYTQGWTVDWVQEIKSYGLVSLGAYVVLCLAAVIEAFVTPAVVGKVLSGS